MHVAFYVNGGGMGATGNAVHAEKDFKWMPETNSPGPLSLFFCLTTLFPPPPGVLDATLNILRMIFKPKTFRQCGMDASVK